LTPPSVRFLGRRVYLGAVVVLVAAMRQGASPVRVRVLEQLVGVSARSLRRWRRWWQTIFPRTRFWRDARCRLQHPIRPAELPRALLERFAGDARTQLLGLLRWLVPLTGGGVSGHAQ
jgi:hypothetical protein